MMSVTGPIDRYEPIRRLAMVRLKPPANPNKPITSFSIADILNDQRFGSSHCNSRKRRYNDETSSKSNSNRGWNTCPGSPPVGHPHTQSPSPPTHTPSPHKHTTCVSPPPLSSHTFRRGMVQQQQQQQPSLGLASSGGYYGNCDGSNGTSRGAGDSRGGVDSDEDVDIEVNVTDDDYDGDGGDEDGDDGRSRTPRSAASDDKVSPLDALFEMTKTTFDAKTGEKIDGLSDPRREQLNIFNKSQPPKKRRKSRTAFTNHQIYQLEKRFLYQKYLTPADRDELASGLDLSTAQVITWFQNRRAKLKRDLEELKADVTAAKTTDVVHREYVKAVTIDEKELFEKHGLRKCDKRDQKPAGSSNSSSHQQPQKTSRLGAPPVSPPPHSAPHHSPLSSASVSPPDSPLSPAKSVFSPPIYDHPHHTARMHPHYHHPPPSTMLPPTQTTPTPTSGSSTSSSRSSGSRSPASVKSPALTDERSLSPLDVELHRT